LKLEKSYRRLKINNLFRLNKLEDELAKCNDKLSSTKFVYDMYDKEVKRLKEEEKKELEEKKNNVQPIDLLQVPPKPTKIRSNRSRSSCKKRNSSCQSLPKDQKGSSK
jgi:heme oxygenase